MLQTTQIIAVVAIVFAFAFSYFVILLYGLLILRIVCSQKDFVQSHAYHYLDAAQDDIFGVLSSSIPSILVVT